MDSTPGATYPFCRACTAATVDVPPRPTGFFLFFGTWYVRCGRKCRTCGSVPRIKFFAYFGIPLIPLGGKSRIMSLPGGRVGRRMRKHPAEDDSAMADRYHVRISKDYLVFSAGHFITYAGDICERLHGHNWRVTAEVSGPLDENHYVIDFIKADLSLRSKSGPDTALYWALHGADQLAHQLTYVGLVVAVARLAGG